MSIFWILPLLLQGVIISLDEFIFHRRRGLASWERIGHPLDTLSLLLCFFFPLFVSYSDGALKIYVALAIFSTILITKDEFVHARVCSGKEHWLHALLFILHPIVLFTNALLWYSEEIVAFRILISGAVVVSLFLLYQISCFWRVAR